MTEERNCLNCGYYNADRCERLGGCCFHHSKWQPIQKAPSFQMTEEEARKILEVATILRVRGDMEIWIGNLKHAGYIRKSALVELVEEAEERYSRHVECKGCVSDDEKNINIDKFYSVIQALKKDHPDFGGKK